MGTRQDVPRLTRLQLARTSRGLFFRFYNVFGLEIMCTQSACDQNELACPSGLISSPESADTIWEEMCDVLGIIFQQDDDYGHGIIICTDHLLDCRGTDVS
jgi:hypothetical protein